MITTSIWPWIGFTLFVLAMLALDLGVFHRKTHAVSVKEAAIWSAVWIGLALAFNGLIWYLDGSEIALSFLTGYIIEKSLSIDNIFVFVLIFAYFQVPAAYQHRVLFWGVLGALIMRAILILVGGVLLERFHWIIYIFGAFLIYTGIKMARQGEMNVHPDSNKLVKLTRRLIPVTSDYEGERFFVRKAGKLMATPLLLVLVLIESTDLVFAVDSIPAIFAVSNEPFIVYTSNIFAILGLRSLYFVLAGVMDKFHYLKIGLSIVLTFVGVKMLITAVGIKIPIAISLLVIIGVLSAAITASLIRAKRLERLDPMLAQAKAEHPNI